MMRFFENSIMRRALAVALGITVGTMGIGIGSAELQASDYDIIVDYSQNEGEMSHIAGGNLHLFDDRTPVGWLSDGVGVYAVRGQAYSNRTDSSYEYLPGFFEEGTYERLMSVNPDVKLMIGLYYGYKGETGDSWKMAAYDDEYAERWAQYCIDLYNDAKEKGIEVYSWIPMNEPDLQWTAEDWENGYPQKFYEIAYNAIKSQDEDALVQGPELGGFYSLDKLKDFLLYCRDNDCLPDILSWHDLKNTQSAVEDDIATITEWMIGNGIELMEIAITEYQGTGYKTDEEGRLENGNYNTGLAVNYIASIERSESSGLIAGLRSEWGLSGGNSAARGDMGELCDFDTKQMPTGLWYVYNAYWDMTGNKVGVTVDDSSLDALTTVDTESGQSGILIGNIGDTGTVTLSLENIPAELVTDGIVHVQIYTIDETLATPCYGADSVFNGNVEISGDGLTLEIDLDSRQACYIVLSKPYKLENSVSAADSSYTISENMTASIENGVLVVTGGVTSSYIDENGDETYVETGDSVGFTLEATATGYYNFTSELLKSTDGGFMQLYVDGVQVGYPVDLYGSGTVTFNHGNILLEEGSHVFEYKLVGHGQNSSSTGTTLRFKTLYLNALGDLSGNSPDIWEATDESTLGTELTGIYVTKLPNRTVYLVGQTVDTTGIGVTGLYDGRYERVLTGKAYAINSTEFDTAGLKTVTVRSTEDEAISTEFYVEVWEVSASQTSTVGDTETSALDNSDLTRWSSGTDGEASFTINFGYEKTLDSVSLLSYDDYAETVSVSISHDGESWKEISVTSELDGDYQRISFEEITAQYLQITCRKTNSSGYHWWSIYELEIPGTSLPMPEQIPAKKELSEPVGTAVKDGKRVVGWMKGTIFLLLQL